MNDKTPEQAIGPPVGRPMTKKRREKGELFLDARDNLFGIKHTSLVLERRGTADPVRVGPHESLVVHGTGIYGLAEGKRYWVPRPIPRGWLTAHVEGNAEPISHMKIVGWDARRLDHYAGPRLPRIVAGGYEDEKPALDWKKFLWPGLMILGGIGVAAYYAWQNGWIG